jgi:hypothetical protein
MPRAQRRNLAKGQGIFNSWATKILKRDLAMKIRGVAHTWYEKAGQARPGTPLPPLTPIARTKRQGILPQRLGELGAWRTGYLRFATGRGQRQWTDDLGVVPPRAEKRVDSAPAPSWRHNWVLVVEETGRRGGHSEGGELWKPRQYIPWKGAGEEVDPEFCGESARGGSQSRVERKRVGKSCQESCKAVCQEQVEISNQAQCRKCPGRLALTRVESYADNTFWVLGDDCR